jgi:hypothetical protein
MGILEPCAAPNPKNFKAQRGDSFFTIKPWIFRYFKKRPHLFALRELSSTPPALHTF